MDTQKIGKFLKELRKEHNMTQEQLGERIGVTNKTVSRWETGNYMPPIESLKLLSDIYQISINEILAGERLNDVDYKKVAEDNISVALEQIGENEKKFENKMYIIMGMTTVLAMIIMLIVPNGDALSTTDRIRGIVVVVLVWALAAISNTLNVVAIALRKKK